MINCNHFLNDPLSDAVLFAVLQLGLVLLVFIVAVFDICRVRKVKKAKRAIKLGHGAIAIQDAKVIRGPESLKLFYGTYAVLNGLLVAICISIDVTLNYRVFFIIVDSVLIAYLCLVNTWFRVSIINLKDKLSKTEK